jgi:hypothetical protein
MYIYISSSRYYKLFPLYLCISSSDTSVDEDREVGEVLYITVDLGDESRCKYDNRGRRGPLISKKYVDQKRAGEGSKDIFDSPTKRKKKGMRVFIQLVKKLRVRI